LQLPVPEDSASIQLSVARINDALINGRIDLKKATGLYYGIQIAAQFIDRKKPFDENKTVQSAEQTVEGDELAPSEFICAPDDDSDDRKTAYTTTFVPTAHRDDDEVNAGESAPNARKPKAIASEIKTKKTRKTRCETVQRAEPVKNQQATDKTAQLLRNCETVQPPNKISINDLREGSRRVTETVKL
jgi:hypothetical protein